MNDTGLARIAGINRRTLAYKLNGNGQFSIEELSRLAAVWGLSVDRLYMEQVDFRRWVADHEDELKAAFEALDPLEYKDSPPRPTITPVIANPVINTVDRTAHSADNQVNKVLYPFVDPPLAA